MYRYGVGVEENFDTAIFYEAFRWFERALDEDEPMAMWRMGQKYDVFSSKFDMSKKFFIKIIG